MNRFLERFASFLIAARWPLLITAVVLAAAAYGPSRELRFDRSIEHMFAPNDPLLPPYQRLKQQFGGNEVVLAVYQDEHLLDPDGYNLEFYWNMDQIGPGQPSRPAAQWHRVNSLEEARDNPLP